MAHKVHIGNFLREQEEWTHRRARGIPNNKKLFVLACMDERLPVEEALDLEPGDAHVFRNAGGLVTDDAIRSAALSIHLFGTREIIIVNHADCGMLQATGEEVSTEIEKRAGVKLDRLELDPGLEGFTLSRKQVDAWWKTQKDIFAASRAQVAAFQQHPLIPADILVTGYVFDVHTGSLRPTAASEHKTESV